MTELEAFESACSMAAEGKTPLEAFSALVKAGMVGMKRDAFEEKYRIWQEQPFRRKCDLRAARERDFLNRVAAVIVTADPPERECPELQKYLAGIKDNPATLEACLEKFSPYCDKAALDSLRELGKTLW